MNCRIFRVKKALASATLAAVICVGTSFAQGQPGAAQVPQPTAPPQTYQPGTQPVPEAPPPQPAPVHQAQPALPVHPAQQQPTAVQEPVINQEPETAPTEEALVQEALPVEPPPPPPPPPPPAPEIGGKPNIAVYVTGDFPDNEKKALGTYILYALVNSGRYNGIERTTSFLAEIDKEQATQRSGAIDDKQISKVGIQFGVRFVCIADITPALGAFQVSARIVNVETAEVAFIGQATGALKTIDDLTAVSEKVVRTMFGIPEPADADSLFRRPKIEISAGAGATTAFGFGGGVEWPGGERVAMPYSAIGGYLFFDAVFAELSFGFAVGNGQWTSENNESKDALPYTPRTYINIGVLGKYPLIMRRVSLFPLLGFDYEYAVSGAIKFAESSDEAKLDGQDDKPDASTLSNFWFKLGAGIDFAMGKSVYLRGELVYGIRGANGFEQYCVDNKPDDVPSDLTTKMGSGLSIKIGVGAKF
jgi:hypothetical protein